MKFTILASGSDGNAALIETGHSRLLIDCGLSAKELAKRMVPGLPIGSMDGDAVIISHCHGDHVGGLGPVLRSAIKRGNAIPIYITPMTAVRLDLGEHPPFRYFEAGKPFLIGDIEVDPFSVLHDAVDPTNFTFAVEGVRIGFSTDLGFVPPAMTRKFHDCQIIVLESNHDLDMLWSGPHPQAVKERVAGRSGHLSNDQASEFLAALKHQPEKVVLGHLSKDNNSEICARMSALRGLALSGFQTEVIIAKQHESIIIL